MYERQYQRSEQNCMIMKMIIRPALPLFVRNGFGGFAPARTARTRVATIEKT
jgi:hypothetical protein